MAGINPEANELLALEAIHHFVEVLDRYFGNVSSTNWRHEIIAIYLNVSDWNFSSDVRLLLAGMRVGHYLQFP